MIALTGQLAAGSQAKADELLQWGIWMTGTVVLVVVMILVFIAIRRWANARCAMGNPTDFSLESLEAMREAGTISDEEFRELRLTLMREVVGDVPAKTPDSTPDPAPETPDSPPCETCEKPE